jgi:glycosyltransferase involved in cell wall biosynthesis
MRIAFYAPMKPPDHPVPSGDRKVANLLMAALRAGGHTVDLVSRLRVHDGKGDPAYQQRMMAAAETELDRLRQGPRYDAWFTYHVYHKSPDLLGPVMASAWRAPYLIAEGSLAPKRKDGPWQTYYREARMALLAAGALVCLNPDDRPCLREAGIPEERLHDLPPFVDSSAVAPALCVPVAGPVRLLAVGMMRPGDKLQSYQALGAALTLLAARPGWTLTVAGDGPAKAEVMAALRPLGDRVTFTGQADEDTLRSYYAASDLLVWPAVNEAFGMAMLEAQAAGLPVVACAGRGVGGVVQDGHTGWLVPPDDPAAFAAAVAALLDDPAKRRAMGDGGAAWVRRERGLGMAAARLNAILHAARQ